MLVDQRSLLNGPSLASALHVEKLWEPDRFDMSQADPDTDSKTIVRPL